MRCSKCHYSISERLPQVEKKVLYLDQNLFSILFKVKSGGRLPPGHEDTSVEIYKRLRRLVLLQMVVLPHSDIHHDETIVFHSARELRQAYEFLGGDLSFIDTKAVELSQMICYARAYLSEVEPELNSDVDEVLQGNRNVWLPDMHISVNADYTMFADSIRKTRDSTHREVTALMDQWRLHGTNFEKVLENEFESFGPTNRKALFDAINRQIHANTIEEPMAYLSAINHPILTEFNVLCELFSSHGVPEVQVGKIVNDFWLWRGNRTQPHLKIFAHLFAALARKVASGQRKVTRGFMNDIMAISTYSPYVDAMFIDKECASLLSEQPLASDLHYRARIFSMANVGEFIKYLDDLESEITEDVRALATRIYGLQ